MILHLPLDRGATIAVIQMEHAISGVQVRELYYKHKCMMMDLSISLSTPRAWNNATHPI